MNAEIEVKVKWSFGGEKTVCCRPTDVIEDVLNENGFESLSNAKLTAIFRGTILKKELTFGFYGIRAGDSIICLRKKIPDPTRRQRLFEQFSNKVDAIQSYSFKFDEKSRMKELEQAKTSDMAFNSWEASPQLPKIYNDLYKSQTFYMKSKETEFREPKTVIPEAPQQISSEPLPSLLTSASNIYHSYKSRSGRARDFEPTIDADNKNYNVSMKKD